MNNKIIKKLSVVIFVCQNMKRGKIQNLSIACIVFMLHALINGYFKNQCVRLVSRI